MKRKFPLAERINYFLERQFVKGAHYQLLLVAGLIGLISVIGGLLVMPTGEPFNDVGSSIWWAFLRLSDPGYLGDDEGLWRRFISTILTIAGYVVFLGALVAIITTWLHGKMRTLERGLTPVTAKNHILILGWTNRTIPIVSELLQSTGRLRRFLKRNNASNLQIIILAQDVTPERLQELKDHQQIGKRAHDIILRSGTPLDNEHLERVAGFNAAAIIIPSHSTGPQNMISGDTETFKILLSLGKSRDPFKSDSLPYVVAEFQDDKKRSAAHRAYAGPLEVIASDSIISRLIAQNVRHPGLSDIYKELLSGDIENNLYVREHETAAGKTINEIKAWFPKAILIGLVRKQETDFMPHLNLPGDSLVRNGDRLVFLARMYADTEIDATAAGLPEHAISTPKTGRRLEPVKSPGERRVLILGWNHRVPALINEFGTYAEDRYRIDMVAVTPAAVRERALTLLESAPSGVQYAHIESDYNTEAELKRLQPWSYDNIIFLSSERLSNEEEADARLIVGYILLEEILQQKQSSPQILLELSDPNNENILRQYQSEVIISPIILSHLLAQVAMRRELHAIYNELFTVGGAEITLRELEEYGLQPGGVTFGSLEALGAAYGETVIGVYYERHAPPGEAALQLNPLREKQFALQPKTKIVVITTIA